MDEKKSTIELKPQVIERSYVDQKKLIQKLRNRYGQSPDGKNNFKVQVTFSSFQPEIPQFADDF